MNLNSFTPQNLACRTKLLLERLQGLDFLTVIEPEEVGLDSTRAFKSSPSGNKYLEQVLNDFKILPQDAIIDIGCGKGSAMRTMLKFPFTRVDGIELSEHIAGIAIRNFKRLDAQRSRIFVCDASLFTDYDSYNMVYFYNPFPSIVMSGVIDALIQSIHRSERELVIVYNNATCHDVVVSKGIFSKIAVYPDEWDNMICIYSNRNNKSSRFYNIGLRFKRGPLDSAGDKLAK